MDLMQRQAYHLWFNWLADKIMEWKDAKPLNTDFKNCIKAMNEIGMFTNQLQTEVEVLHKRVSLIRQQKNDMIQKQKEQIEELENKLKQYNMEYEDMPDEITYCRMCGKETNDKTYCSQNCKDYDLE